MRFRWLAGLLAAVLLAAGCNMQVEPYLVPPKLQGEQLEIQKALDKYVTGTLKIPRYILKYPKIKGQNSAFIMTPLTTDWMQQGDPDEAAIVFYQDGTKTGNIHINMLRLVDGEWQTVSDIEGLGTEVENVAFGDLDGDGQYEMLVGWNIYNSQDKQLHVYSLKNYTLVPLSTESVYSQWFLGDVTSSGKDDLVLFRLDGDNQVTARLKTLRDNRLEELGTVRLDGYIQRFGSMRLGRLTDDINGLYVDAVRDAGTTITELIYWDKGVLNAPFYDPAKNSSTVSARSSGLASRDIDMDGQVEYPSSTRLFGYYETKDAKEYMWLHQWYVWDYAARRVKPKFYSVVNSADGYYMRIDNAWKDSITTSYDAETRTLWIHAVEGGKLGEAFLGVRTVREGDAVDTSAEKAAGKAFTLWYKDVPTGTAYSFWYSSDNPYGLNDQAVRYMLSLLIE